MSGPVRVFDGVPFRNYRVLNPGQNLYLVAGTRIAVETWALDWGKHEFDYELNSRSLVGGRPGAIATTRTALQREFLERRVVTRYPIPVSVGFNGMNKLPDIALTLGEVKPQVYTSKMAGPQLGWSLAFRSHRHHGAVGGKRASTSRVGPNASSTTMPGSGRGAGLATGFNYLMVYLPVADFATAREMPGGFGVMDMIGTDPSLWDRWTARIFGQ